MIKNDALEITTYGSVLTLTVHRYPTINSGDTIALRSAYSYGSYSTYWLRCHTGFCYWTTCTGSIITSSGWNSSCSKQMIFTITAKGKTDGEPIKSGDTVSLKSTYYSSSYRLYCSSSSSSYCCISSYVPPLLDSNSQFFDVVSCRYRLKPEYTYIPGSFFWHCTFRTSSINLILVRLITQYIDISLSEFRDMFAWEYTNFGLVVFVESPVPWQETPGWAIPTLPSRSTPRTLMMGTLCNMATWWVSNSRTVQTAPGWLITATDFIHVVAATTAKHHAQRKTLWPALKSSRSCPNWSFEELKFPNPQPKIQAETVEL